MKAIQYVRVLLAREVFSIQGSGAWPAMMLLVSRILWLTFAKELEIMCPICRELTSKQIAPLVGLTRRSVEIYREKIREKTGALNSVGIALYAVKNGIYKG